MLKIDNEIALDFSDVLIKPKISAKSMTRGDIDVTVDYGYFKGTPIVIAEMLSIGTYKMAKALVGQDIITFIHKEYSVEEHLRNLFAIDDTSHIGITSGVNQKDIDKTIEILSMVEVGFINIHIANVYTNVDGICEAIKQFKNRFPHIPVVAGVIATPELVKILAKAGADIIRVGVGSGAACKTRSEVGVGVPQFTALSDCSVEAKKYDVKILACGGITNAGDVAKAIGIGADFVILGSMVAGSSECDNIIEIDNKKYVNFYGLGSFKQYEKHGISQKNYRPNEGRDLMIPVVGSVNKVINQVKGGLRSACTYVGAPSLSELYDNVTFVRVNNQINTTMERYEQRS